MDICKQDIDVLHLLQRNHAACPDADLNRQSLRVSHQRFSSPFPHASLPLGYDNISPLAHFGQSRRCRRAKYGSITSPSSQQQEGKKKDASIDYECSIDDAADHFILNPSLKQRKTVVPRHTAASTRTETIRATLAHETLGPAAPAIAASACLKTESHGK